MANHQIHRGILNEVNLSAWNANVVTVTDSKCADIASVTNYQNPQLLVVVLCSNSRRELVLVEKLRNCKNDSSPSEWRNLLLWILQWPSRANTDLQGEVNLVISASTYTRTTMTELIPRL